MTKRLISGVLVIILMLGMTILDFSAEKAVDYSKYAQQLDKFAYDGDDLGAVWSKDSTTFKLWSPTASSVKVRLYKHGSSSESKDGFYKEQALSFDKVTGVWSVTIKGNFKNKYYIVEDVAYHSNTTPML